MTMTHAGLPGFWVIAIGCFTLLLGIWTLLQPTPGGQQTGARLSLERLPVVGPLASFVVGNGGILLGCQAVMVSIFVWVIAAGLFGTPVPGNNLATVLTWNVWWSGLIISVFFAGSAWCAVCPWDALARWLVNRRFLARATNGTRLNLRVPQVLRNVWPAVALLCGFTWLELGLGITFDPHATASVALLITVMAVASQALFERKAFCRYFCPVGRTIGAYSQLAPIELRPINTAICASCTSLECYHGTSAVDPCPTFLVMGRMQQNTYCTSCGNCTRSCPHRNIAWRLRPPSSEVSVSAHPRWDEAWFMLVLMSLTLFHGLTMMPFWEPTVLHLGGTLGWTAGALDTFTLAMLAAVAAPIVVYAFSIALARRLDRNRTSYRDLFTRFAFVTLPLTFTYHLAHNLNHLMREGGAVRSVLADPFGRVATGLSMSEQHARHLSAAVPEPSLFCMQALLMIFGIAIAMRVIRDRCRTAQPGSTAVAIPIVLFTWTLSGFSLWLLAQPMVMRF